MPGKHLLLGADLPANVYWQWRRWCTKRDFYACDIGKSLPQPDYAAKFLELRIAVAEDDVVVPFVAVQRYAKALASAEAKFIVLKPQDYGLPKLGHISCLTKGNEPVWAALLGLE